MGGFNCKENRKFKTYTFSCFIYQTTCSLKSTPKNLNKKIKNRLKDTPVKQVTRGQRKKNTNKNQILPKIRKEKGKQRMAKLQHHCFISQPPSPSDKKIYLYKWKINESIWKTQKHKEANPHQTQKKYYVFAFLFNF